MLYFVQVPHFLKPSAIVTSSLLTFLRLTLLLFYYNALPAQSSGPVFEHLTTAEGMSSNKVESIIQDHNGFYWIATQNGLNRFDGTKFKIYRSDSADSTSLSDNHCTALAEDHDGNIWVATYKGVSKYNYVKGTFERIYLHHPNKNFEIANRIYNITCDRDGNIWLAAIGLWRIHTKTDFKQLFLPDPDDSTSISDGNLITQLVYDSLRNGIWLSTGRNLNFYNIERQVFYHHQHNPFHWKILDVADGVELTMDRQNRLWFRKKDTQSLSMYDFDQNEVTDTGKKVTAGIKKIEADLEDRIWIFYWRQTAEVYDPSTGKSDTSFFKRHHLHSALHEKANALFIDRNQQYWISSGEGINIYNKKDQFYSIYHFPPQKINSGQEPFRLTAIAQTTSGELWVGSNLGLYNYILSTNRVDHIPLRTQYPSISTICSENTHLWIGAYDELVCLDNQTAQVIQSYKLNSGIIFIEYGGGNDLWVGLWTGGLYKVNLSAGSIEYFSSKVEQVNIPKSNNTICGLIDEDAFWVGYNGGAGFSKFNTTWTHFHPKEQDTLNASAGTITVLTPGLNHSIWIGTHGGGMFHFDPDSIRYIHYQQQEGLKSNYINSILIDTLQKLWISTADGLCYFNPEKNKIIPLDIGLVFTENDFIANSCQGIDGRLFFFCQEDIISIDPSAFQQNAPAPQIVISSFSIFDQEIPIPTDDAVIKLSHKQNFFTIGFSSIHSQPHKEVTYAYRLRGFDKDWMVTHHSLASYTNVPDGHYVFEIKVADAQGSWSDHVRTLPVVIKPPYWRTWWFFGICGLFAAALLWSVHQYRVQQIKKIYALRSKISRDLHDDIGSSLSSIHLYTTIAEREVTDDLDKTKTVLRQINQRSRQIIENISDIVWANQTGAKEKSSLAGRIMNYGYDLLSHHNIECKYQIDPKVEKKLSSPEARRNILLIIKEALNNMAKYSGAQHAEVNVSLNGSFLYITIQDDGSGFDTKDKKSGNGLNNMKLRAQSLRGNLDIHSAPGKGTQIDCQIPLPNISEA